MNIELHIERLILDGVAVEPGRSGALRAALEAELTRLLSAGGLSPDLAGGVALPRVSAGAVQLGGEVEPAELGRQIAGSVYGGIGK